jgi:hypothetical protein
MPNTLVHFAAQGAVSRGVWPRLDARWIYLGCLLPDLPWILRRAVVALGLPVDAFDLRLYTMALASLAGTLLLCAALASVAAAARLVFVVLGANALLHLLLDATELKFGNGVHLAAPFSWRMTSFDLVPGESLVYVVLAAAGGLLVLWELTRPRNAVVSFVRSPPRVAASAAFLVAYLLFPMPFLGAIQSSDSYSVKTLREVDARPGRTVRIDRTAFHAMPGGGVVHLWTGEDVRATGELPARDATISLQGTFLAPDVLRIDRLFVHRQNRDWPSYVALVMLALLWARPLLPARRVPGETA